ncbi:MAG: SurA N-terminal domain-containing protein [Candidatus Electrothrix sp. GW3-4]|uniref:SurA N-terminal domain-containing protein n=1 Tax=Candidatus Electrothrix sp. GW3-4 TaxID=3126740 RepID=UPI0030CC6202
MKMHWLYLLLTFLLVTHVPLSKAEIIDSSVAVVNEDVITRSDVNKLGEAIFQKITKEVPPEQREEVLNQARQKIITQLIENKLLTQQAVALNISVADAEVDRALEQVLQRNDFSNEEFREELKKMGLTKAQYRETLREQILRSKLINYEVRSKVVIPDEEIQRYFEQQYSNQARTEGYYLLQLGVSWADPAKSAGLPAAKKDARKQVEAAYELANKGQDFKKLVRQYSNLPSAADDGDLGLFKKDEMAAYMRDAVTALQPGEISPIIERPDSYMFFLLLSKGQEEENKERVLDENLKEEIRNKLYKQEAEERYKKWLKKIRSEAYIKILSSPEKIQ